MSILKRFKDRQKKTAKTASLPGGIHENVDFVDFKKDLDKKGDFNKYLFMKFKKFDDEGNPIGEFATSFMELDTTSSYLDFKTKILLVQMHNLAVALFGDEWEKKFDPLKGLVEEDECHYKTLHAKLEKRVFVRALETNVKDGIEELVNEYFENGGDKRFVIKIVYNDKGYVNLPNGPFIQDQADDKIKLSLTDKEISLIKKFAK